MRVIEGIGLAALSLLTLGGQCSNPEPCVRELPPPPMTETRAKALEPNLETGLGISTTLVYGDCRPQEFEPALLNRCGRSRRQCVLERIPARVLIFPAGVSVPVGQGCGDDTPVEAAASRAISVGLSNDAGEWTTPLAPGVYLILVSEDDMCAGCGLVDGQDSCQVEIRNGEVTVRNLVLDRAFR